MPARRVAGHVARNVYADDGPVIMIQSAAATGRRRADHRQDQKSMSAPIACSRICRRLGDEAQIVKRVTVHRCRARCRKTLNPDCQSHFRRAEMEVNAGSRRGGAELGLTRPRGQEKVPTGRSLRGLSFCKQKAALGGAEAETRIVRQRSSHMPSLV
jgi:hypothetical protein